MTRPPTSTAVGSARLLSRLLLSPILPAVILVSLGFPTAAAAQTGEQLNLLIKQQQEQLKRQEEQLKAQARDFEVLRDRVEALTRENAGTQEIASEKKKQGRGAGHAASATKESQLVVEDDENHTASFKPFTIPGTDTHITIAGFAKMSINHDFDAIDNPAEFVTSDIVVDGDPSGVSGSKTSFSANASRFSIGTTTPTDFGKLSTFVSLDFFGDDETADPRLRQAYGQLDDFFLGGSLLGGQAWSTWADLDALPETLDFEGPNSAIALRQPMVRWSRDIADHLTFKVAIEKPESEVNGADGETRWPDGVLVANYHDSWGHLQGGALLRDLRAKDPSDGDTESTVGWGVALSGQLKLSAPVEKDNFSFQAAYGRGIGRYISDLGSDDGVFDPDNGDLEPLDTFAAFSAYQHWWADNLRSNAVFGYVDINKKSYQTDTAFNSTIYVAGDLIWSPIEQVDIGVEFLWGKRENKNGATGDASRLQLSTKFKF